MNAMEAPDQGGTGEDPASERVHAAQSDSVHEPTDGSLAEPGSESATEPVTESDTQAPPAGEVVSAVSAVSGVSGVGDESPSSEQPAEAADGAPAPRTRRQLLPFLPRNVKITLMVLFAFFIGEYILLPELASARREFHQLSHLNFLWLIVGALLEVAALAAYAELTHTVLSPGAPDRFRIFRINMWALAISHTLPGGTVPGTAASYRLLTESDVSGSTAAFGLAAQGMGSAVVLNIIFWLSLLISIPLQGYNPLYGFAALLGVILLSIFAAVVFLLTRGEKQTGLLVKKVADRVPFIRAETLTSLLQKVADRMKILSASSDLLVKAGVWAAANWLLDCASLYVFCLAFGAKISPIDVLVAYGLANILAVIPLTPGGLGVVELTVVAVLKGFGVPGGVAAAGVLSWRLVNFWLPIPFGGLSYLSLRFGHARSRLTRASRGAEAATS
jgi:putative heme transporter